MMAKRHLRLQHVLALLAALSLSGCKKAEEDGTPAAVAVKAAHPTQGPISEEIAADAILAPLTQAALAPRISAPILKEYVQRGAHVRKGQLLMSLDDRDLRGSALDSAGAVTAAQANLTAVTGATVPEDLRKAELDVAQLQAARDVAAVTANERKELFRQGALSGRDADAAFAASVQAQSALDTAKQHLESVRGVTGTTTQQTAQGQLQSARGRLINAEAQVSYANLRSPIDGVVTDRPLFAGETSTAGNPLITIMDTSAMLAKLHLAQAIAQKLAPGQKAEIHLPGIDDPITATVSFISPALDPESTTVEVWLKLANADGRLKAGTPVHAVIRGNTVAQALLLPPGAILPAKDGGNSVLVVGSDGVAHKRAITAGIRTDTSIQVVSGLSAGDVVVTEGGYGLDDGTRVTTTAKAGASEDKD